MYLTIKYNHIGDFDLFIKLSKNINLVLYSHRLPLTEYMEKIYLLLIEKMKFMSLGIGLIVIKKIKKFRKNIYS